MQAERTRAAERMLLAAIVEGDREAFGQVFDLHVAELRRFARDMLGRDDDAVLHEAFLDLWRHAARLDATVPIRAQLHALVMLHGRTKRVAA